MYMCEEQDSRLDQMQASGGTAAIAPMPAFFTTSLHPDSMCLFVFVCVCPCVCIYVHAHICLDVGIHVSLSDFGWLLSTEGFENCIAIAKIYSIACINGISFLRNTSILNYIYFIVTAMLHG